MNSRRVLAVVMAASGLGFASATTLWPLLLVGFMAPMNPGGSDVSIFLPLEHSILASSGDADFRTQVFARYSFVGSLAGAQDTILPTLELFTEGLLTDRRLLDDYLAYRAAPPGAPAAAPAPDVPVPTG